MSELANYQVKQLENEPWNILKFFDCENFYDEFEDQNSCPVCKRMSKNNQQNHRQYDNQELYCDNSENILHAIVKYERPWKNMNQM